jgi:DNA-binding transcriptional ArsR family regulator
LFCSPPLAPVFAALGDETCRALLINLCEDSPQSISELTEGSYLTRQAITRHLQVLEGEGLVTSVRAQGARASPSSGRNPSTASRAISIASRVNGTKFWAG